MTGSFDDKLIVALDVSTFDEMSQIVESIGDAVSVYKVGHQLFTAEGPRVIDYLKTQNKRVFLDLKLHEIPNSVAQAVHSAARHGVEIVTAHASGGRRMLEAATQAANEYPAMKVLALTVVTGLDQKDLHDIGIRSTPEEQVRRLTSLALGAGCHGVIASAREVTDLRKHFGDDFIIVTPGIRPSGAGPDDQSRIGSPAQSIKSGANAIIVGRPIVQAENPEAAAMAVVREIAADALRD